MAQRLTGARFSARELLELAAASEGDTRSDEHLKAVFEWYHSRAGARIRGFLATAATIVAGFLVAALDESSHIQGWHVFAGSFVIWCLVLLAAWANSHLAHLQREYVAGVRLLRELQDGFRSQLSTYFKATGGPDVG